MEPGHINTTSTVPEAYQSTYQRPKSTRTQQLVLPNSA